MTWKFLENLGTVCVSLLSIFRY